MRIAVSECLCGVKCRYDGGAKKNDEISARFKRGEAFCVCPECMGGMSTPRRPSEIVGGDGYDVLQGRARVMNDLGEDVTEYFIRGAYAALEKLKAEGASAAVLKSRSPSCGCGEIYDGTFSGSIIPGDGVAAALLKLNGITVTTDEAFKGNGR